MFGDENIIELKVDDSNIKRAGWHLPSSIFYMADTMGAGIRFDCTWLLKYKNLHTLWLGKKAKKKDIVEITKGMACAIPFVSNM